MKGPYLSLVFHLNDSPSVETEDYRRYVESFAREVLYLLNNTPCNKISLWLCGRALLGLSKINAKILSEIKAKTIQEQIEWLGGGFYDPLFPLLPVTAQKLQIKEHQDLLYKTLGVSSRGVWLSSFVWEDSLIDLFSREGFEYTVLKDYQIQNHLWKYPTYKGYWTVEDRGQVLRVLSSQSRLFQQFRDREFGGMCDTLFSQSGVQNYFTLDLPFMRHSRGHYEGFWFEFLKHFFVEIEKREKTLGYRTLSSQIDSQECGGAINLGCTIGKSLGLSPQLKSCRDLLIFHPECNYIHKKMLILQNQIEALADKEVSLTLQKELLPVQSVFYFRTHGETGGVHLLADRSRCMDILLEVEGKLRKSQNSKGLKVEVRDFLSNGSKQIYCHNRHLGFMVEHNKGGRLRSLEYRPLTINLINGFKQPSPLQSEHYHISPVCAMQEVVVNNPNQWNQEELHAYLESSLSYHLKTAKERQQILLSGEQPFQLAGKSHIFQVEKVYTLKGQGQSVLCNLQFTNATFNRCQAFMGLVFNFSFKSFDVPKQYFKLKGSDQSGEKFSLATRDLFEHVQGVEFYDKSIGITVKWEFGKEALLSCNPVYDRQNGEFQYFQVAAFWPFSLLGQEKLSLNSTLVLSKKRLL
jgi:hypothetical protein